MNRLTKKCMIASAGMHALLLVALMVGSAFTSNKVEPMPQVITLVNAVITDGPTRGGGNPNVQEPPPAAPEPAPAAPQPAVQPPQREPEPEPEPAPPEPPREVKLPDPPKVVETVKTKEPDIEVPKETKAPVKEAFTFKPVNTKTTKATKTTEKVSDTKPKQEFQLAKTTRKTSPSTGTSTASKGTSTSRHNDISRELGSSIGKIASSIRGAGSGSTSFEMPGPGGTAYVNYGHAIVNIYQRAYDRALTLAGEIADGDDSVDVAVTIARDGRIVSSRITRNSRNTKLNNLVKGVLDRVDHVPDFPAGARDAQRTINITFDLKSRRLTG